jgi:hypothetical protein
MSLDKSRRFKEFGESKWLVYDLEYFERMDGQSGLQSKV